MLYSMSKTKTSVTVRDAKSGRLVTVRGVGALKDSDFAIEEGVDLTKPIAAQAGGEPHRRNTKKNAA